MFVRLALIINTQSWASLVDKTALDGIPPHERKRQEAIFELIATESAYVHDLQLIVEVRVFECNTVVCD